MQILNCIVTSLALLYYFEKCLKPKQTVRFLSTGTMPHFQNAPPHPQKKHWMQN